MMQMIEGNLGKGEITLERQVPESGLQTAE